MLLDNKKKMASIIVAKLKGDGEYGQSEVKEGPEQDNSMAMEACGKKMLSAIEGKDAKSLVSALKEMLDMVEVEEEKSEPEEVGESME